MTSLKSLIPSEIETNRLLLHLFNYSPAHYRCLIKCFNSKSTYALLADFGIRTQADVDTMLTFGDLRPSAFANKDLNLDTRVMYVIRESGDGLLVGFIMLSQRGPDFPPDLGWWILDEYQGQGYAFEAAKAVFDMLQTRLRLDRVMVWPGTRNLPGISVAKKLGFVEGSKQKSRRGEDVLVYVLPGMKMKEGMVLSLRGDA